MAKMPKKREARLWHGRAVPRPGSKTSVQCGPYTFHRNSKKAAMNFGLITHKGELDLEKLDEMTNHCLN